MRTNKSIPASAPNPLWCARERCGMPYIVFIMTTSVFVILAAWIVMFAIRATVHSNRADATVTCTIYNISRIVHPNFCENFVQVTSHNMYGTFIVLTPCDKWPRNHTKCYKYDGGLHQYYPQSINITALTVTLIITGVVFIYCCILTCALIIDIYCERKRAAHVSNVLNREIMLDDPNAPVSSMDRRATLLEPMLKK